MSYLQHFWLLLPLFHRKDKIIKMIHFFQGPDEVIYGVAAPGNLPEETIRKMEWLFSGAYLPGQESIHGTLYRAEKGNGYPLEYECGRNCHANMGIEGIERIEEFRKAGTIPVMIPCFSICTRSSIRIFSPSTIPPEPIRYY
jgi:hypothetical protein